MTALKVFLGAFAGAFVALIAATIGMTTFIGIGAGSDQAGWGLIIMMFAGIVLTPAFFVGILGGQIMARSTGGGMLATAAYSALACAGLAFLVIGAVTRSSGDLQTSYAGLMAGVGAVGGAAGGLISGLINREARGIYG